MLPRIRALPLEHSALWTSFLRPALWDASRNHLCAGWLKTFAARVVSACVCIHARDKQRGHVEHTVVLQITGIICFVHFIRREARTPACCKPQLVVSYSSNLLLVVHAEDPQPSQCLTRVSRHTGQLGTRQLTVNTCLVNAYDVLKPPCMAAALAYSMRRRPIVVAYIQCGLLIRARGC